MSSEQQHNTNQGFIPDLDMERFESKSSGLDSGADTLSDGSSEYMNEKLSASSKSSSSSAAVVVEIKKSSNISDEYDNKNRHVAIIGSGDFGRALASRMVQREIPVIIGSRNPDRNR